MKIYKTIERNYHMIRSRTFKRLINKELGANYDENFKFLTRSKEGSFGINGYEFIYSRKFWFFYDVQMIPYRLY